MGCRIDSRISIQKELVHVVEMKEHFALQRRPAVQLLESFISHARSSRPPSPEHPETILETPHPLLASLLALLHVPQACVAHAATEQLPNQWVLAHSVHSLLHGLHSPQGRVELRPVDLQKLSVRV